MFHKVINHVRVEGRRDHMARGKEDVNCNSNSNRGTKPTGPALLDEYTEHATFEELNTALQRTFK
jgi:hypothetical protein